MIADEGCAERGCPMHDSMWTKGVQMVEKKEWVGLTPADRVACEQSAKGNYVALWAAIEAKLKEKNKC